jgi:hypothetical protein
MLANMLINTTSKLLYCHGGNIGDSFFLKKREREGSQKGKNERQRLSRSSNEAQHHLPIILFMQIMAWNDNVTSDL